MVSREDVMKQLTAIKFNYRNWNRAEARELENIILPNEIIFECVNGWYQGGGALLVATNLRVLLIDKKIMNFLAVEDVRFDTIAQIDYGHRFLDAHICINTGLKELKFRSYNKIRLRNLISLVQKRMAEIKLEQQDHSDDQTKHLEQLNQKLNEYLYNQQLQGDSFLAHVKSLEDGENFKIDQNIGGNSWDEVSSLNQKGLSRGKNYEVKAEELYKEGAKEVFSKSLYDMDLSPVDQDNKYFRIAYAKLPLFLRDRRKAQASFAHLSSNANFKSLTEES